jgi:hypothetical protein
MIFLNIETFLSQAEPGRAFKILRKRGGKGKAARDGGELGKRVKGKG